MFGYLCPVDEVVKATKKAIQLIKSGGKVNPRLFIPLRRAIESAVANGRTRAELQATLEAILSRSRLPNKDAVEKYVRRLLDDLAPGGLTAVQRSRLFDRLPVNNQSGRWIQGEPGEGVYRTTDIRVRRAAAGNGSVPEHVDVTFRGGAPDFNPHVRSLGGVRGQTNIVLDVEPRASLRTRADRDFAAADSWFANQLNAKNVPNPSGQPWNQSSVATWRRDQGLTWHHHENMTTMQLMPEDVNYFVRHIGGRTLRDEMFKPPLPLR